MRTLRRSSLLLALLLLPVPAEAALTPVGPPLVIAETASCSFITHLEVTATPAGAFEVVWADGAQDEVVKGQRFARNLEPTGSPRVLLPIHGGLFFNDFVGTWAGRYEVALNAADFGNRPADPLTGYRVSLDLEGDPLAPPARFKPPRFLELAPAARGESLQFRIEPPFFGPPGCQSQGLLASRINAGGAALSAESRVTRRASAWSGGHLAVDRLANDTFVAVYSTCERFTGLVARRLNAAGAPVGNPINLSLPGRVGNLALAARTGADFAVAAIVFSTSPGATGGYTRAVMNGQVFGPTRLAVPPGHAVVSGVIDLAASPSGGYLLLFQGSSGDPLRQTLFAQQLDMRGVPQGAPLAITGGDEFGVAGAVASLPDGRWIVVTRAQSGVDPTACSERVVGTVLAGD